MTIDLERYRPMLQTLDDHVYRAISRVSLVAEADILWPATLTALKIHVLARDGRQRQVARRFHEEYRYGLSAGIVAIARDRYRKGGLWPYVNQQLNEAGLPGDLDQLTQTDFREVFIETLRALNLPTVGEGYSLVDTAAMHAGIPTYCLGDWFNLTRRGRRRVGDDPSELTRWARQSQDLSIMNDIDQPIKRMIVAGPEFAEDLFERAAELLDALAKDYSNTELEQIGTQDISEFHDHPALTRGEDIGLEPRWVVMAARNLASTDSHHSTTSHARNETALAPVVRLNFIDGEVELRLPEILGVDSEIRWHVRVGDTVRSEVASLDTTGDVISSKPITVPVRKPTRVLHMTFGEKEWQVPLWQEGSPAVLFGPTGQQRATSSGVIPPGPTWVLAPSDATILVDSHLANPTAEDDPPIGWSAWSLRSYAFDPTQVITIRHAGSDSTLRVRGGETPLFLPPDPVPGAWSYGLPVVSQRPTIQFPQGTGPWRVTVSRRASAVPVWTRVVEDSQDVSVLDGEFGQVGTFDLVVRGPLGRGLKETFVLVDGLRITCSPPHRRLGPDGRLEEMDVQARAALGIQLWPTSAHLASNAGTTDITFRGQGDGKCGVRFFPPATMVGLEEKNGAVRWGPRPVRVDAQDIDSTPHLYLRLPNRARDTRLTVWAGTRPVQVLEATPSLSASRYSLSALKDTLVAHGDLHARLDDEQPIAWIGSMKRASGMHVDAEGVTLTLEGVGDTSSLEVWAWLADARWRGPTLLDTSHGGVIRLPEHLCHSGPLTIHERTVDPWVELPSPSLATARKTHVECPGQPTWTDSEARLIATAEGVPVELGTDDAAMAIAMLTGPDRDLFRLHPEGEPRIREACTAISNAIVETLNSQSLQETEMAAAIIRTGIYSTRPALHQEVILRLWQRTPVLGALFATQAIGATQSAEQPVDDIEVDSITRFALSEFGDSYLSMLHDGTDPFEKEGYFSDGAIDVELMPAAQQDLVIAYMRLVPKALLDRDSRSTRIADITRLARNGQFGNLPDLASLMAAMGLEFRKSPYGFTWAGVTALTPAQDRGKHRWIPPFVRAVALAARAQARGGPQAPRVPTIVHRALTGLVSTTPSLVMAELVRAEAILSARNRPPTPALPSNRPAGGTPLRTNSRGVDGD